VTATLEPAAHERDTSLDDAPSAAKRSLVIRAVLVALVVQFLAVGLWQAARDSPTVDEAVDVASGVTTVVRHDLRLNPEHAPLPKLLSALPALLARPVVPDGAGWQRDDWFEHTDDFIRANRDAGRLDRVFFLARLVPLLEGAAVGVVLFVLGRRLFGEAAGALAATLWLSTPVFVGFAHFAMIDVPFTLATLIVSWALVHHLDKPSVRRACLVGGACAIALLTRHNAIVLTVVALAVVVGAAVRGDRRNAIRFGAVVGLVAFLGVWAFIRVVDPTPPTGAAAAQLHSVVDQAYDRGALARLSVALPFPLEYRAGFGYLALTSDARPAYAFGHAWNGSTAWFFPASLVTKLPLPALLTLVLAPFAWRGVDRDRRRVALLGVAVPAVASFAFLLGQPLNLGLRYAFPVVALAFVLAGPVAGWFTRGGNRVRVRGLAFGSVALALAVQLAAFWQAAPSSLAWTAPPFRPAYQWVSDSNVDYGQDLDRVEVWARDVQQRGEPVWTALLLPRGFDAPAGTNRLLGADARAVRGWVAVSATRLTALDRDELSWLRAYCPVGTIDGSVLLYRFAGTPDTTPGPTMPASSCFGATASTRSR
jgi:hypothetical protein